MPEHNEGRHGPPYWLAVLVAVLTTVSAIAGCVEAIAR